MDFDNDTILAIDGDWIVFKIAWAANSQAVKKGEKVMPLPYVYKMIDNYLAKLADTLEADGYVCLLTARDNFRKKVKYEYYNKDGEEIEDFGECLYKANRKGTDLPLYLSEIRNYLIDHHGGVFLDGGEADDGLGMWATQHPTSTIMVHNDKDINMIPGRHYNPNKEEYYEISKDEANMNALIQILKGDSIDNIPSSSKILGLRVTAKVKGIVQKKYDELTEGNKEHFNWYLANVVLLAALKELGYTLSQVSEFLMINTELIWIHRYESQFNDLVESFNGTS